VAYGVEFQSVLDKYAASLQVPRLLFDLWPKPRPVGRPIRKFSALPASTVLAVVGAFEGFAEDLLAAAMVKQGRTWAHIAKNADLTNPSLKMLVAQLDHACGISALPKPGWTMTLPRQTGASSWADQATGWSEVLTRADGWVQVRHCLSHGLVTGLGPEKWPSSSTARSHAIQSALVSANDHNVLAKVKNDKSKRGLYFWPSVACARIYSVGAGVVAEAVAAAFGDTIDVSKLDLFSNV
jgi:hypothetical protein